MIPTIKLNVPTLVEYQTHVDNFDRTIQNRMADVSLDYAAFLINLGYLKRDYYISEVSDAMKGEMTCLSDEEHYLFICEAVDRAIKDDSMSWADL